MRVSWLGASCALALSSLLWIPSAGADRGKRSLASCTSFDQVEKSEDTLQLTIANSCTMPVNCSLSWRVVCAPTSRSRRAVHPTSKRFALDSGASETADASAAVCGDDAWQIESIQWSCQPAD